MKIGVDLDHTIIDYQYAFLLLAREGGYVPQDFLGTKTDIKNFIIAHDSEVAWMRLQGAVYSELAHAQFMPGVFEFFKICAENNIPTVIISHKTQFGHFDEKKRDLRDVAMSWLVSQHFFDGTCGLAFNKEHIFFESTREKKIARIVSEACTHFIDDLPEVLMEPSFPTGIHKLLYAPTEEAHYPASLARLTHWNSALASLQETINAD